MLLMSGCNVESVKQCVKESTYMFQNRIQGNAKVMLYILERLELVPVADVAFRYVAPQDEPRMQGTLSHLIQ